MATKFVAAVALLALCHANPVLINGILYRDGRAYSESRASSYGGGVSTAQAKASGGEQLARDGSYYPGHAIALAQTNQALPFPESAYGAAKAVAQAQNGAYYPIPAPATVITYEQNFAPAASSVTHAESYGAGDAQSSANTEGGGYGRTSSHTHTHGSGSANSNANSRIGSTSTSAESRGDGFATSVAQNAAPAMPTYQPAPAVVDLRTPIYYTSYVPTNPSAGVASSNAQVAGAGQAAASAKSSHGQGRTISWRFGTLYDAPASAHAQANTYAGNGAAKSAASNHYGHGIAQSSANSQGDGSAKADANVNSVGYGVARSTADVQGLHYGGSSANVHTHGPSRAASSARTQGTNTVANSQANSFGHGFANANALAV